MHSKHPSSSADASRGKSDTERGAITSTSSLRHLISLTLGPKERNRVVIKGEEEGISVK